MRLKIVDIYDRSNEFECITDRHGDSVAVSMFRLCEAAGLEPTCLHDEARKLIGREFEVNSGLIPATYMCRGTPKLVTDGERWKDLGESRCERCSSRFCECATTEAQ